MAHSKENFEAALRANLEQRPVSAQLLQAGDPRILAQIGAMASFAAMLSQQIDLASAEPFVMARDTTVLAAATMRGIMPFARPAKITLSIQNTGQASLSIAVGRRFIDHMGRIYVAESGATIAAGGTALIAAKQATTRVLAHTVANSASFYPVQILPNDDRDLVISSLVVSINGAVYPYTPEFANLAAGEPGFALETDDQRRMFIKFGWDGVFGVQPKAGDAIAITVEDTAGELDLSSGATFAFESALSLQDGFARMALNSVQYPGADPISINEMRQLVRYPALFDESAVFLGNFDALIRRKLAPSIRFLSVWNEQIEEQARGANVANINRLFVSVVPADGVNQAWIEGEIARVIAGTDNSYRVVFVPAVDAPVSISVAAEVSTVHDPADVSAKIMDALLSLYGRSAVAVSRGMLQINRKAMGEAVKQVPALQSSDSDFNITIVASGAPAMPEHFRYLSQTSISIVVTQSTFNANVFGH